MLKVTVELFPHDNTKKSYVVGELEIWNDETGDENLANYQYRLSPWKAPHIHGKTGVIKKFPRKVKTGWDLIFKILG